VSYLYRRPAVILILRSLKLKCGVTNVDARRRVLTNHFCKLALASFRDEETFLFARARILIICLRNTLRCIFLIMQGTIYNASRKLQVSSDARSINGAV